MPHVARNKRFSAATPEVKHGIRKRDSDPKLINKRKREDKKRMADAARKKAAAKKKKSKAKKK